MAEALSTETYKLIEDVCARYRSWDPGAKGTPQIAGTLDGGLSNSTVLLRGSRPFVLRLAKDSPTGVCRHRELRLHRGAAARGLAPEVRFADAERGILLTEFVDGSADDASPAAIAALLRGIHGLHREEEPQSLSTLLRAWARQRDAHSAVTRLLEQHRESESAIDAAARLLDNGPVVVCHNDLLAANRRSRGQRLLAIDWEYAAPGSPFFDLAVTMSELPPGTGRTLLRHYLDREPDAQDAACLAAAELVYALIAASWFNVHRSGSAEAATATRALAEKLRGSIHG